MSLEKCDSGLVRKTPRPGIKGTVRVETGGRGTE